MWKDLYVPCDVLPHRSSLHWRDVQNSLTRGNHSAARSLGLSKWNPGILRRWFFGLPPNGCDVAMKLRAKSRLKWRRTAAGLSNVAHGSHWWFVFAFCDMQLKNGPRTHERDDSFIPELSLSPFKTEPLKQRTLQSEGFGSSYSIMSASPPFVCQEWSKSCLHCFAIRSWSTAATMSKSMFEQPAHGWPCRLLRLWQSCHFLASPSLQYHHFVVHMYLLGWNRWWQLYYIIDLISLVIS